MKDDELGRWADDTDTIPANGLYVGLGRNGASDDDSPTRVVIQVDATVIPGYPDVKLISQLTLQQAESFLEACRVAVESLREGKVPEKLPSTP